MNITDAAFILASTQANIVLAYEPGSAGNVTQSAGAVDITGNNSLVVGREGIGVYDHSGGTVDIAGSGDMVVGNVAGGRGTYNLTGASAVLTIGDLATIGNNNTAIGVMNMSAGTMTLDSVNGDLRIGNNGPGFLNQSGGTINVRDNLQVGNGGTGRGTYNMSGNAVLNMNGDELRIAQTLGSTGAMVMDDTASVSLNTAMKVGTTDAGTLIMNDDTTVTGHFVIVGHNATGVGTMTMNGNSSVLVGSATSMIGNNGNGTLVLNNDSSFTASGTRSISLGNNDSGTGHVTVNDNATLSSGGALFLGQSDDGTGTIIQNGGLVESRNSNLVLGRQQNAQGTFILNDGNVSVAGTMLVGRANSSDGTFNQNGGTVVVGNNLQFGDGAGAARGTYTLSAGTLIVANTMSAPAAGTFLLQGGALQVDTIASNLDDFQWGAGTLASYQPADLRNIVSNIDLTTTAGSVLDLGAVYQSQTVLHETLTVNGTLDLTAGGDELTAISSINLLRTLGHGSRAGRVDLISATSILGEFDIFNGPTDSIISESLFDPLGNEDDLVVNTFFLDYSTPGQITFLYKISNTVPEPSTVGLLAVSLVFLRGFARKRYKYQD